MTPEFQAFLKTGVLPPSMAARSKILDIARNRILSLQNLNPPRFPELDLDAIRGNAPEPLAEKLSTIH